MKGIQKPKGIFRVEHRNGNTSDIISTILKYENGICDYTKGFAKEQGIKRNKAGLHKLWHFVRFKINYKLDPEGWQIIQSPSVLYWGGKGDCKSKSLFIISVLQNLKINYTIRFTSYVAHNKTVKHVYVIAHLGNENIILDSVWHSFNSEKQFKHKKDIMAKIAFIGTTGAGASSAIATLAEQSKNFDVSIATENQMSLHLMRENLLIRAETAKPNNRKILLKAAANLTAQMLQSSVSGIGNMSALDVDFDEMIENFEESEEAAVSGRRRKKRPRTKKDKKGLVKRFLNWIAKRLLPRCGFLFLYTTIKQSEVHKLPGPVQRKRKRQMKLAKWVQRVTGMSHANFIASVGNGIRKKFRLSPLALITKFRLERVSGIGAIAVTAGTLVTSAIKLIKAIAKVFKKKTAAPSKDDVAGAGDWDESTSTAPIKTEPSSDVDIKVPSGGTVKNPITEATEAAFESMDDEKDAKPEQSSGAGTAGGSNKMMMIYGAVVVAGFLFKDKLF